MTTTTHRPGQLLGGIDLALGLVLICGGVERTSSFSFAVAKDVAPIRVWGAAFLLVGALSLFALRLGWVGIAAVISGSALHTFWAVAFLTSAYLDQRAALTAIPVYLFLALLHMLTGLRLIEQAPRGRR